MAKSIKRCCVALLPVFVLALIYLPAKAQFPEIPHPRFPSSLDRLAAKISLRGEEPVSTNFSDAENEVVLPDEFSPKQFTSLLSLPIGPSGGVLLRPGAYEAVVQSFCLHAGTHGPTQGEGYLYAPLKGSRAIVVHSLLRGVGQHPAIPQNQVQELIWAIEARAKISDLPPDLQHTASVLLTKKESFEVNGGALGLIPSAVWDRALESVPSEERQMLEIQAELRRKLSSASSTFEELERIAVLEGPALHDGPRTPGTRWSSHPGGFFVRYLPNGYKETKLQVYVPDAQSSSHAGLGTEGASGVPLLMEYESTQDVAVPADTAAQRLGLSSVVGGIPAHYTPCERPSTRPSCKEAADKQHTKCILDASALEPGDYRNHKIDQCVQDYKTALLGCMSCS
jgi:hypothetical protein